jgi:DNA-binding LytR/AlgR family response regulator
MAYRCLIVEDQVPAQRILQRYIAEVPELELLGSYTDPLSALAFLREKEVDILFLDIHLPKLSGMDFLKVLPYQPKVILTTAFSEYALEGYEYSVVDYLLKPISFERFLKAVLKVIQSDPALPADATPAEAAPQDTAPPASETPPHLFVKSDRTIIKLSVADIIYIKAEEDFTHVYTEGKNHFLSYTLKFWEETLPSDRFCRIHKSYIVNIDYIDKIEGNQVFTKLEALPIGRSYRDAFMSKIPLE